MLAVIDCTACGDGHRVRYGQVEVHEDPRTRLGRFGRLLSFLERLGRQCEKSLEETVPVVLGEE